MGGWKPIETAPNNRDVLIWTDRRECRPMIAGRFFNTEEWGWSTLEKQDDWIDYTPTHWMPLPEPPVSK